MNSIYIESEFQLDFILIVPLTIDTVTKQFYINQDVDLET